MKKSNCPRKSICAGPSEGQGGALAVVKRPVVYCVMINEIYLIRVFIIILIN